MIVNFENRPVLRESDMKDIEVEPVLLARIPHLMTPEEMLMGSTFPSAEPIIPPLYPNFDSLLEQRDKIRTLELLPMKSEKVHQFYKSQPVEDLTAQVKEVIGSERLVLAPNNYPNWLPADLRQSLLWMGERSIDQLEIVNFCAKAMTVYGLGVDDVIMFERPVQATDPLLKGTFKPFRHIHFWMRS